MESWYSTGFITKWFRKTCRRQSQDTEANEVEDNRKGVEVQVGAPCIGTHPNTNSSQSVLFRKSRMTQRSQHPH